jgi:hypothetical protein
MCNVKWNPALLQLDSVVQGTFFSTWASANGQTAFLMQGTIDNTAGTLTGASIALLGGSLPPAGVTGSGTFLELRMTAKSSNGTSAIDICELPLPGGSPAPVLVGDTASQAIPGLTINDGQVTVGTGGTNPTSTGGPTWTPSATSTPIPTATAVTTTTSHATATPQPTNTAAPTPKPTSDFYGQGTVSQESGGTVQTGDGKITLIFPEDAVAVDSVITIELATDDFQSGRTSFIITAASNGVPFSTLGVNILICVKYTDADVEAVGGNPEQLKLAYFNEYTGQWVELDTTVNTDQRTACAYTNHLSQWALLGGSSGSSTPMWFWYLFAGCDVVLIISVVILVKYRFKRRYADATVDEYSDDESLGETIENPESTVDAQSIESLIRSTKPAAVAANRSAVHEANTLTASPSETKSDQAPRAASASISNRMPELAITNKPVKSNLNKYNIVTDRYRITVESAESQITVSSTNHDTKDEISIVIQRKIS